MAPFVKPPWPGKVLQLLFSFDLKNVPIDLSMQDHEAAVRRALASVSAQINPDGAVVIRRHIAVGNPSAEEMLLLARDLPKDEWNATDRILEDGRPVAIRLEFLHVSSRKVAIRVLTELPRSDGVSATRVALHTLEELENPSDGTVTTSSNFKKNPTFVFGLRNALNMASRLSSSYIAANWPFMPEISEREKRVPTTVPGLRHYYSAIPDRATKELAVFKLYRSNPDPSLPASSAYKGFVKSLSRWHDLAGFHGFFNLNNFSTKDTPSAVALSIVPKADDLLSTTERYKHIFTPAGSPPTPGPVWDVLNCIHAGVIFSNNYGRHDHSFKAIPELFSWDWLGMMAPIAGAGVISINGVTMAWTRWTREGQDEILGLFEDNMGKALLEINQAPKCIEAKMRKTGT